jgi:uncharacterized protein YggE
MELGILRISETSEKEITASSAKLHLSITGENFVFGDTALEKSREVKRLVDDLKTAGIKDENLFVSSVSVQTESGFFAKSSKATYTLRVDVHDLALLSQLLGVVSNQKQVEMERLEWVYDEDTAQEGLSREAMQKAKRKADAMAEAVQYRVVGLRSASDSHELPDYRDVRLMKQDFAAGMMRSREAPPLDIGTEFRASITLKVTVSVEFLIQAK